MNTTRDPRLPNPMNHARQVTQLEHDRQQYEVGQRIAYDVRVYDYKKDRTHDERREAVIVELWIEDWHGRDLPYAECLTDEGPAAASGSTATSPERPWASPVASSPTHSSERPPSGRC